MRTCSDIDPTIHQLIVADIIVHTTFFTCVILFHHGYCTVYVYSFVVCFIGQMEPGRYTRNWRKSSQKCGRRYRGWRSTLSSTYKAYKTDAARLANLPEDLQPEEWEWMIEYFGTDSKFQVISKITVFLLCVKMKWLVSLVIFGFNELIGSQPKEHR